MSQAKYSPGSCLFFSLAFVLHGWKNQIATTISYVQHVECPVGASRQDEWPVLWPRVQGLYCGPAKMTLGECWRVLAQPSDEWNQADSEGRSSRRDVAQELCLESWGNSQEGATSVCQNFWEQLWLVCLAQHRDSCPAPGCSTGRVVQASKT